MDMFKPAPAPGPEANTGGELAEKVKNLNEYKATPHFTADPVRATGTSADRVNPAAHYGDRGGEKRIDVSDMVRSLPSHHDGTPYVDHTGPAMLEKGEAVIRKEDNPMHTMNLASELGTPEEKIPARKLKHIETRKAGKGHIHVHHYEHPAHKPTEHASVGTDGMVSHMMDHMSEPNPGEQEANEGQSGIPAGTPGME